MSSGASKRACERANDCAERKSEANSVKQAREWSVRLNEWAGVQVARSSARRFYHSRPLYFAASWAVKQGDLRGRASGRLPSEEELKQSER